jgi:hypothetical protein
MSRIRLNAFVERVVVNTICGFTAFLRRLRHFRSTGLDDHDAQAYTDRGLVKDRVRQYKAAPQD